MTPPADETAGGDNQTDETEGRAMLRPYIPILFLGILGAALAVVSVLGGGFIGPKRYNRAKLDAYEGGIEPTEQAVSAARFPVKFYLTAMLFIVFDIEIIFLYPWAVAFGRLGLFGLVEICLLYTSPSPRD